MIFFLFKLFFFFLLFYLNYLNSLVIKFIINEETNPIQLTNQNCYNKRISCYNLALPLIIKKKYELFGHIYNNWKYSDICKYKYIILILIILLF